MAKYQLNITVSDNYLSSNGSHQSVLFNGVVSGRSKLYLINKKIKELKQTGDFIDDVSYHGEITITCKEIIHEY